jgi:hypothetical protein
MGRTRKPIRPAPYSHTDHSETRAVDCLKHLLDDPHIKSHFAERDKAPNIDGFVELVDDTLVPLGKLEVQIKHLNRKDRSRLAYSCELRLLAYCRDAPLPVILVGVAAATREAFWVEITRKAASKLIARAKGKQSVTVRFPRANAIHGKSQACARAWSTIAVAHVTKLRFHDKMAREIEVLRTFEASIHRIGTDGIPDKDNLDFSPIQTHLDALNGFLERDFRVVRDVLFPDTWKVGFGFADYTPTSLAYCYYPVRKGRNDLLARRVSSETFKELDLARVGHPHENPVLIDPSGFAREYVRDKSVDILDARAFSFDDDLLIRELLFAVADQIPEQLGIAPRQDSLSVEELRFGWQIYLPHWVDYVLTSTPKEAFGKLFETIPWYGSVDLDSIWFCAHNFGGLKAKTIDPRVRRQIKQGKQPTVPFPISVKDLPLRHVNRLLAILLAEGVKTIDRVYPRFDYGTTRRSGYISDWWSHQTLVESLKHFYDVLPRLFDHVVQANFPGLAGRLKLFDKFNRRIVVVDDDERHGAGLQYHDLRGGTGQRIDVYSARDNPSVPAWGDKSFVLDGVDHEVRGHGSMFSMFMFHPLPLLTQIADEIKGRIKDVDTLLGTPSSGRLPSSTASVKPDGSVVVTLMKRRK